MRLFIGGLTSNVTEDEIKGRFSVIKNLGIQSVEIMLREDGICKGFAYINTNTDDEEAIGKLIKLYNGTKWRGRVLKVEIAKPSYLERIKEDKESKNKPIEEPKVEEEEKPEPLSGVPNTIMIRKSKRKFLVVSLNTIHRDENGCYLGDVDHSSIPKTVEVPINKKEDETSAPKSTKKHRFIQPEVTCFEERSAFHSKSVDDLWKPIKTPKKITSVAQIYHNQHNQTSHHDEPIVKSSIKLDDDLVSLNQPPPGLLSESEEEQPAIPEQGVVTFSDDDEEVVPPMPSAYYEESEEENGEAVSQKREWSEKLAEIVEKRQRVEMDEVNDEDEDEDLENLNLEAENQKLAGILHSMIGNTTVASSGVVDFGDEDVPVAKQQPEPEPEPIPEPEPKEVNKEMNEKEKVTEMQSLFDDKSVSSFSLFNFLPTEKPSTEESQEPEQKANILDSLAPTAWYNESKPSTKTSMITIPVHSTTESVLSQQKHVRRDFSSYFYRTRSMEEVEKEWEQLRPNLLNDFERKKKNAKRSWKKPSDSNRKKDRK